MSVVTKDLGSAEIKDNLIARRALDVLIRAVENTGGLVVDEKGHRVPAVDREWGALALAYALACEATDHPQMLEVVQWG